MPTRILLIPVLLAGCLDVPSPPPPLNAAQTGQAPAIAASTTLPSHFAMILKRDHGMWTYRACSLEITLFLNASRASFDCDAGEGGRVQAAREMTHDEVTGLRRLAQAADLYGGDHLGEDFTPGDGSFETLRVRPVEGGRAVVLVTSGNRSFVDHEARRELLRLLDRIGSDLSRKAGLGGAR
jgi:hypothetical protein